MSKPEAETFCTGPIYIFDCEVEDYQAEQSHQSTKPKGKAPKPKPNRAASKRGRRSSRKPRP